MKQFKTNKLIFTGLICLSTMALGAQNIAEVFINMPDKLIPTLNKQQRFELMEYSRLNRNDSVKNRFDKYATVESYDTINQSVIVKNTKQSIIELKLFNVKDSNYNVGIIETILQPIKISTINFYNKNWDKSELSFNAPEAKLWIKADTTNDINYNKELFEKLLLNSFIALSFDKSSNNIIATNNSLAFLSLEDKKMVSKHINNDPLIYIFKNNSWQLK